MTSDLAARQAELVAALVAGAPVPDGFDPALVGAAADALLRKRAGEVAKAWPLLAAGLGSGFGPRFTGWARGRPSQGSFADGFAFALSLGPDLPALGARELAEHQRHWVYDGAGPPRRRPWLGRTRPPSRRPLSCGVSRVPARSAHPRNSTTQHVLFTSPADDGQYADRKDHRARPASIPR